MSILEAARAGAAAALTIVLAACAVGPDYRPPDSRLEAFHNLPAVTAHASTRPPTLEQWWLGFNDPVLASIVERSLEQNLDLAASLARVAQARSVAKAAGADLRPTVDLDASASALHESLNSPIGAVSQAAFPGFNRSQREYTLGPSASWELDLFGGLRRAAHAAQDEYQAAEADRAGTRITVAADAADAYLQIRGYQARIAVAREQIDTDTHLLALVQARVQAGEASPREAAQASALLQQARASLPPLRNALEAQLNRLDVLMGSQPGTVARELSSAAQIPAVPAIGGDNQPLDVLRRRPDVIAAERRLAESNERIGAALSDYYPKISLAGALGFDSLDIHHFVTSNAFQAVGTGALRWRLFDFGRVDAEVAQARGAHAEAWARYRQAVLEAAADVENALSSLSETRAHVLELQGEVAALLRARDLSQHAYQAGSITLTDVLDADRELLAARDELDSSQAAAARAAVGVYRALGGGWTVPAQAPSAYPTQATVAAGS